MNNLNLEKDTIQLVKQKRRYFKTASLIMSSHVVLQHYMVKKILGIIEEFQLLVLKKKKTVFFSCMNLAEMPGFAVEMVGNVL